MRAGRGDREALARSGLADDAAQPDELVLRLGRRLADGRVRLDQAGEELGLQPFRPEQPLDAGGELERLRVEEHQLLLDAQRQPDGRTYFPRTACTGRPAASQA